MVLVPSLTGLSRSSAESAIEAAGLIVGSVGTTSGSSSQDNKVAAQGIASGTLVDYDTQISFTVYDYVAPSGPYVVSTEQISATCAYTSSTSNGTYCVGTTKVTTYTSYTYTQYRRYWSDGSTDTYLSYCGATNGSFEQPNSTDCGYVAPPPAPLNCNRCVSSYNVSVSTSSCASGAGWLSVCFHEDGCNPSVTESPVNCVPVSQVKQCECTNSCNDPWSGACINGQQLNAQRCTDCDCNPTVSRWFTSC
jgi:hypothetical protein